MLDFQRLRSRETKKPILMRKNLYSDEEILKIFSSIKNETELIHICNAFHWLIESGFLDRSPLIYEVANDAFRRIFKIEQDEN